MLVLGHIMSYPTCSDIKDNLDLENQEVASCRHFSLEHHEETRSEHPVGEDSGLEK